ncbi:MAG: NUDIX hydrolase [Elusimicrobiota bacterium]|jgi:ADP-ribose pyrophosphatase|nr:NUDIX hydrolase [Elusimicrobiota bacterium]
MEMKENFIKRIIEHKGKAVNFYCDEVLLPNGRNSTREYLDHPGASCVLPFLDENRIVLVKQYRYPIGKETFEIPAGKIDKGETPIECIKRELKEETGYSAGKIDKVLSFSPTPAFSNEILHIFAAFDLKQETKNPDEDEFLSNEIADFKTAIQMIYEGQIIDAKTIIALLYFNTAEKNISKNDQSRWRA